MIEGGDRANRSQPLSFAPVAAPPPPGPPAFTQETLIGLIRHANAFLHRGDDLGTPLSDETRRVVQQAVGVWTKRLFEQHLVAAEEPVTCATLIKLAMAADNYVVGGDGAPAALQPADVALSFAFRQAVVTRAAQHPNGAVSAELVNQLPAARAAWERARQVPRPALAPVPADYTPTPPHSRLSDIAPPPAPKLPGPPAEADRMDGDAFRFPRKEGPAADPQAPASATPAGTGQQQAAE